MPKIIIDLNALKEYYGWILLGLVILILGIWLLYHKIIKPKLKEKRLRYERGDRKNKDAFYEDIFKIVEESLAKKERVKEDLRWDEQSTADKLTQERQSATEIQNAIDFEKFKPPENIPNTLREWGAYLELKEKNLKVEWRDEDERQKIDFAKSEQRKKELFEEAQKVNDKLELVRKLMQNRGPG